MSIEFKPDLTIYNEYKQIFNTEDYTNNDENFENINVNKNAILNTLLVNTITTKSIINTGSTNIKNITNNNTTQPTFGIYDIGYFIDFTTVSSVQIPTSNVNTQLFTLTLPCYGLWLIQTVFSINTAGSGGNSLTYRDLTITSQGIIYFRSLSRTSAVIGTAGVLTTVNDSFIYRPLTLDPLIVSIALLFSGTGTINVALFHYPLFRAVRIA